jgi:hypothetical protein
MENWMKLPRCIKSQGEDVVSNFILSGNGSTLTVTAFSLLICQEW